MVIEELQRAAVMRRFHSPVEVIVEPEPSGRRCGLCTSDHA